MTVVQAGRGRFVDIDARRVHVEVEGSGKPVVFEAGAGEWSAHWALVTKSIAEGYRCISYDRAGLGRSDPVCGTRSASVLADELLALLDALEVHQPAILVAHSFGASIARLAADRAPGRVSGIVFVDGWHESFAEWEERNIPRPTMGSHVLGLLDRIGALRVIEHIADRIAPPKCPWSLPADAWASIRAISNSRGFRRAAAAEADAYAVGDNEVASVTALDVPVVTLVAEQTLSPDHAPPRYPVDAHNAAWRAASSRLSDLSPRSEMQFISATDHMVQLARPQAVVDAIVMLDNMIHRGSERR